MENILENIKEFEKRIEELESHLNSGKSDLENFKMQQRELFDNYTKSTLNIDDVDNDIMDLSDKIREATAKIEGLEARILNRKRNLLLYKFQVSNK